MSCLDALRLRLRTPYEDHNGGGVIMGVQSVSAVHRGCARCRRIMMEKGAAIPGEKKISVFSLMVKNSKSQLKNTY